MSEAFFRTLSVRYLRSAQDAVKQYEDDAAVNNLKFDRHAELLAVQAFAQSVTIAAHEFLQDISGAPLISNWNRVTSAIPDFFSMLREAVNRDNGW
jgi:glucosyl-3-phosphoglycerate synthase